MVEIKFVDKFHHNVDRQMWCVIYVVGLDMVRFNSISNEYVISSGQL